MSKHSEFHVDLMSLHEEVTGSCHLCVVRLPNDEKIKFLVDCGLFQEKKYLDYNKSFTFNPEEIEFAIATHNHIDHIGRFPLLTKNGFTGKIYGSELEEIVFPHALLDTAFILMSNSKRHYETPLYNTTHVDATISQYSSLPYFLKTKINDYIYITLFPNPHVFGAAMSLVTICYEGQKDINLLFTGDYSKENAFFETIPLPDYLLNLDLTIIEEATYGLTTSDDISYSFEENIMNTIAENKKIFIPVFSFQRAQEILLKLAKMQKSGKLSKDIKITLDGKLSIKYTKLFARYYYLFKEESQDFYPDNFSFVTKENRKEIIESQELQINLSSSGMGTHGPAPEYIKNFIDNPNTLIHLVGYPAEDTLARALKETPKGEFLKISGIVKEKKADVLYTQEFSSHAKLDELINFLKQFNSIKLLIINHGEHAEKENIAKIASHEKIAKDVAISSRDICYRIGPYGIVKSYTSKF